MQEAVQEILAEQFPDRVYTVEDGVVWVGGMNAHCPTVARRMAQTLVAHDIPCGLVYDDGGVVDGVQFNYAE